MKILSILVAFSENVNFKRAMYLFYYEVVRTRTQTNNQDTQKQISYIIRNFNIFLYSAKITNNLFYLNFQVKVWFQNRRTKHKREQQEQEQQQQQQAQQKSSKSSRNLKNYHYCQILMIFVVPVVVAVVLVLAVHINVWCEDFETIL